MSIIEFNISKEMYSRAFQRAEAMGAINGSVEKGKGNLIGFLAEEVVSLYLNVPILDTRDYDMIYNNVKIDVKAQGCTARPEQNYEVTVYNWNTRQECDIYVFVRVEKYQKNKAWIVGWQGKEQYFTNAVLYKKGDVDPSNNYVYREDKWNSKISTLRDLEKIKLAYG
jgi:hypothetical protein